MSYKGWIGVDLDGTLAYYDKWRGIKHVGAPIMPMVKRVREWLESGTEVRIFTARVGPQRDDVPEELQQIREAIEAWCVQHIGRKLEVTAQKDYGMVELWDDRAVQVIPNTGARVDQLLAGTITRGSSEEVANSTDIKGLSRTELNGYCVEALTWDGTVEQAESALGGRHHYSIDKNTKGTHLNLRRSPDGVRLSVYPGDTLFMIDGCYIHLEKSNEH